MMKITNKILALFALLIWGIITISLIISIIGIFMLLIFDADDHWTPIPDKLINYIIE